MGVAGQSVLPVLLVVALAVIAFCAPMLVVVLSRGSVRSVPRRATTPRSPRSSRVVRPGPSTTVVRAERSPLPRREERPSAHDGEMAGTVLHAVHPAQDPARVVAALTDAGFATVVDPDNALLLLVESPADVRQHELVRSILTRRVA